MNFGIHVNTLRKQQGLTLQQLAKKSNVSTSMLSQIEREEKNPTLQIACQIAEALNTTLSALLKQQEQQEVMVIKKGEHPVYIDQKTGFQRHLLSPSFPSKGIEFVFNIIPPKSESGNFPAHQPGVEEYIYVVKGCIEVILGDREFSEVLEEGDSFYFKANTAHQFINHSKTECHYYLVINSTQIK